jgi:hypothetical protein
MLVAHGVARHPPRTPKVPHATYKRLIGSASSALLRCSGSNLRDRAAFAATVFKQQQLAARTLADY